MRRNESLRTLSDGKKGDKYIYNFAISAAAMALSRGLLRPMPRVRIETSRTAFGILQPLVELANRQESRSAADLPGAGADDNRFGLGLGQKVKGERIEAGVFFLRSRAGDMKNSL